MRVFCFPLLLLIGILYAQAPATAPKPGPPKSTPAPVKKAATPVKPPATPAKPEDKVVLTVGEETVTAGEFQQLAEKVLPENVRATPDGRRNLMEQLVKTKVLAQEARKRKIDQRPDIQMQIKLTSESLLAGTLMMDLSKTMQVDEAEVRKYYDEHKSEYERVKARHILIRFKGSPVPVGQKKDLTEEEALEKVNALRARIIAGEEFASIARAESDDTQSGARGGDLDFFSHGQMVGPFEQAAFALEEGKISDPVKTQFGYHLILVDKHEIQSFEQMRPQIEKQLLPKLADKAVETLKGQTTVKIDDAYLGAPAAK